VPWSSITVVRSSDRTVVFLRDHLVTGYIPSSAFASREEQAEVVAFAEARVRGSAQVAAQRTRR